jgi:hypothetical protein
MPLLLFQTHRSIKIDRTTTSEQMPIISTATIILLVGALIIQAADVLEIFSKEEMDQCYRFRTPNLVRTPNGDVHVIARCCGANLCSGKSTTNGTLRSFENSEPSSVHVLHDNIKDCKVIMKSSKDGGTSWGWFQVLSPAGGTHYGNGGGLWDIKNNRLVVQFQLVPGGSTAPAVNVTTYQIYSYDQGGTWTEPIDINDQLALCNPDQGNMMMVSAGNKLTTPDGRLLWGYHDHAGNICVVYSDNGGESYNVSQPTLNQGNEISITTSPTEKEPKRLLINGRGDRFFGDRRANYWSPDNGDTWSGPQKSSLPDDDGKECERSLITYNGTIYTCEPDGRKRREMTLSCSTDGGATYPNTRGLNGDKPGGYSDLSAFSDFLLAVWEDNETGNMFAAQVGYGWC